MEINFQVDLKNEDEAVNVSYHELVGFVDYLAITRPKICFATSFLGRFLDKPFLTVWRAAKRVLQYIKQTKNLSLTFKKNFK